MSVESPTAGSETERTSLPTHVDLCELRYRSLERRMSAWNIRSTRWSP
ncbi:MAG: hypothetical protein WDO24_23285 [Pseudomonadota bacterium]